MKSKSVKRLWFIAGIIGLWAFLIIAYLYKVQIFNHEKYALKADRQYVSNDGDILERGSIFFSTKENEHVTASGIKEGYIIVLNPRLLKDIDDAYYKLSSIIDINREQFEKMAKRRDTMYIELAKRVDAEIGKKIQELKISGIRAQKERWRYYPGKELASHVLGYYGYGNDKVAEGQYGLEKFYEKVLGRKEENEYSSFIIELISNFKKTVIDGEEMTGDVITNIEPTVQQEIEKVLLKTKNQWSSDIIGGIIINPKNGEIYAMSALPSFDPNSYGSAKNVSVYSNPLVQSRYEMGSIIKPLTMACGLDSGIITEKSSYKDEGFLKLDGYTIRNSDNKAHGKVLMPEVLSKSLNLGSAYIALKMGEEKFANCFNKLGIGELSGIDLPYEVKGDIKNLSRAKKIEIATASFGQGIAMTPIATVKALSTLANGGYLVTPHVMKELEYRIGTSHEYADDNSNKVVFSSETTDKVTDMLVLVVDNVLKNGKIKEERWSIAAKTGTAQIADPTRGGYYTDRYLHSFFGYFPAKNPQFLVFLYQIYPKGAQFASETLTDPFHELAKFLISYYEVPPDR